MSGPRVLLLQLSERTSARGTKYLSGFLGKASVVAFLDQEPNKWGNPVWSVYVSTPEPKPEARQERLQARDAGGPAKRSAQPAQPRDGWRGSHYRRPANGAPRAPAADDASFYDDTLEDVGR